MNDYCEILGATRGASQDEIRKAYRKKARRLHPGYARPESEEAFKELSIAYGTLSDPGRRRLYNAGGANVLRGGASPLQDAGGSSDFFDAMFSDFFDASSEPAPRRRCGADQLIGMDITLREAVFGTQKTVSFVAYIGCETCHGSVCTEGTRPVTCSNCGGSGTITRVSNTMFGQVQSRVACGACRGYGTIISSPCQECASQGRIRSRRSYPIDIPAGVTEGTQIGVPNKTEVGPGGGPQGDLYLEIRELADKVFVRRGGGLYMWTTIPMTTVAFNTDFMLSTFGRGRTMTIPAGTQPGEETTLKELGIGRLQRLRRGSLHVHIEVEIPKKLDARSRGLLEELTALRKEGGVEPQRHDHSMFEELKEKFARQ